MSFNTSRRMTADGKATAAQIMRPCSRPNNPADVGAHPRLKALARVGRIPKLSHHGGVAWGQTRGISRAPSSTVHEESAMTTLHQPPKLGTREHFLQVSQLQRWGTIQEYVDLCRTHGYFTPEFYATAIAHMERIHVRRMLRQVTDGRGWPTVANIVRADPNGRPERVFM